MPHEPKGLTMIDFQETRLVSKAMIKFGGDFVGYLGKALIQADDDNVRRIYDAFPEYWQKYHKLAIEYKLGEENDGR